MKLGGNEQEHLILPMYAKDWEQVREIYAEGITTGQATFETKVPSWDEWDSRHLKHSRFVMRDGACILGWAALSPVSTREAYRGVAEVSVYVREEARGKGIGGFLLEALIKNSEQYGTWTLQASIFPENEVSIKLHLRCGFRIVGRRERIGKLNDEWRDTMLLERRT